MKQNVDYEDYYSEIRKDYVAKQYDQGTLFDKNIFLISSGIFGVSFSFISSIVSNPSKNTVWLLSYSWYLIILCIIGSLTSYIINYYAYLFIIKQIDGANRNKNYDDLKDGRKNVYTIVAETLNITNLILLIGGLMLMLIYVYLNMEFSS